MILYNHATIDSLSMSIPIEQVEIIDKNFTSKVITFYYDTEQFDDEIQNCKPLVFSFDGITIRFRIAERLTSDKHSQRFIIITLSSKLLKSRYFEGITKNNIDTLYNEIMSFKVFKCPYDVFLDSHVSDVDLCTNYKISQEAFINSNKKLVSFALLGKDRFFNLFLKKNKQGLYTNLGLDINTRQKAKPSHPYLKNYYKSIELTTKSLEFYNKFLKNAIIQKGQNIRNLARIEYTIKGYSHKERLYKKGLLKLNYKTLRDVLNLTVNEMKSIIYSGFKDYCQIPDRNSTTKTDIKGLSPTDSLIVNYMQQLILKGSDKIDLFEIINDFSGTQKTRLKSKIESLYNHLINDSLSFEKLTKENEELNNFLDMIR